MRMKGGERYLQMSVLRAFLNLTRMWAGIRYPDTPKIALANVYANAPFFYSGILKLHDVRVPVTSGEMNILDMLQKRFSGYGTGADVKREIIGWIHDYNEYWEAMNAQ